MPFAKKRKIAETSDPSEDIQNEPATVIASADEPENEQITTATDTPEKETLSDEKELSKLSTSERDQDERRERFRALQARAKNSAQRNLKETAAEAKRLSIDANQLASLSRKAAFASHNLLKADTAAAGEDFERKRAWDWTIEESEKWDKRMSKKERHREDVAFQDYRQDARKIYKRQLRELNPDLEGYEKDKAATVQRAVATGGMEVVETEDGELIGVDKNGAFSAAADRTDFFENKPPKTNVDRLVADIKKAEETRLRKRRERGRGDEDGDVTYINDKNKEFNKRLARSYNKYTAEIRDSFERGTMI